MRGRGGKRQFGEKKFGGPKQFGEKKFGGATYGEKKFGGPKKFEPRRHEPRHFDPTRASYPPSPLPAPGEEPKGRDDLLYGINSVLEALRANPDTVERIYLLQ